MSSTMTSRPPSSPQTSKGSGSNLLSSDNANVDPDELFAKYTISEVKFVQQRLRADADAKQEELRLMVGERYRDLLQASTSIISIAQSSKRVKESLEHTKEAILARKQPPPLHVQSVNGIDDEHLHTLQLLSAHMKLLLDAPEHLWRLIERRKYYPAAWLFLLARVVHRALGRTDDQEEATWLHYHINVSLQFPLVERQWDAVSQFRSQIIHKATLSLREFATSPQDTCATLLTLHLLDSRPLAETLSVLLNQRSKTLQTLLLWSPFPAQVNGHSSKPTLNVRRASAKEIQKATQTSLEAIAETINTARAIFAETPSKKPLIVNAVHYMQSDLPSPELFNALPPDLQLTTQSLLTTLPSSAHFLFLPQNLRSYKPYVDINSLTSSAHQSQFAQKLDEWLHKATLNLKTASTKWFSDLHTVKEVWTLRLSIRAWARSTELQEQEIRQIDDIFDTLCQEQVISIWRSSMANAEMNFKTKVSDTLTFISVEPNQHRSDTSPVEFLFSTPALPLNQPVTGVADSSFKKYKAALKRQIVGRTSLLDDVLVILENCTRSFQQDLSHISSSEQDTPLIQKLKAVYAPDTELLCTHTLEILDLAAAGIVDAEAMPCLVFVGRITNELSSSSSFIDDTGSADEVTKNFRESARALYERILDRWRKHTVLQIVKQYRTTSIPSPTSPNGPSSNLIQSLLSLSSAIQELGVSRDPKLQQSNVAHVLRLFVSELLEHTPNPTTPQDLFDFSYLRRLVEIHGLELADVLKKLEEKIETLDDGTIQESGKTSIEHVARTQILFGSLFGPGLSAAASEANDKTSPLLIHGSPALDRSFQSAIDLAKPSSRLLLLVGGR